MQNEDFVALNAKDFLAERDGGSHNVATKGDSKAEFFRLRPIIFDIVTDVKNFIWHCTLTTFFNLPFT